MGRMAMRCITKAESDVYECLVVRHKNQIGDIPGGILQNFSIRIGIPATFVSIPRVCRGFQMISVIPSSYRSLVVPAV